MKLKINLYAGIIDLLSSILYLFSVYLIWELEVDLAVLYAFIIFAFLCVILHIYAFMQCKKNNMKILGHVLGIMGHFIYEWSGIFFSFHAFFLLVIAGIVILKENK